MAVQIKTLDLKIGGKSFSDKNSEYSVKEVSLSKELLKPNKLEFSIRKKVVSRSQDDVKFKIADDLLGANVEFKIETNVTDKKGNSLNKSLSFKGIIININSARNTTDKDVVFNVIAFSFDYLLHDNLHCYSYEDKKLSDIVKDCIKDYNNISTDVNPKMDKSIPYVVQYNETSYEFLKRMAQRYGEFFYYEDGKMVFGKITGGSSVTLNPGIDIIDYKYEFIINHVNFTHYCHNYLDYKNNTKNAKTLTGSSLHKLTDYSYNHSDSSFKKLTVQNLHSGAQEANSIDQLEASLKVQGLGSKSKMFVCHAHTNRADLKIGSKLKIHDPYDKDKNTKGGELDHDELIICEITHRVSAKGKYENEIFAIPANAEFPPYANSDAYPYAESQRAKVTDNKDPEKLGRIRVQFIWQELQSNSLVTPWLRIAQPYGGGDKGFYYIPEIGEEVIVGFENGNAEKPFVIGTLYHGKQKPESKWADDKNNIKAIRTRNGHTIEIHDVDPGGYISIYDNGKNNYKITLSTDDKLIKLESKGNIELLAGNDIIMKAEKNITIEAKEDISVTTDKNMTEMVKNNMKVQVTNDHTVEVKGNQTVNITKDKNESISKNYTLNAADISNTASGKMQLSSQTHEQSAKTSMKIEGGQSMDLKSTIVNVNS